MNLIEATNYYLQEEDDGGIQYVYIDFDSYEDDYDMDDLSNQADRIVPSGMSILRGKELKVVAVDNGEVVGAMWNEMSGDVYSFDVVVRPDHERMGIGKTLVGYALGDFDQFKDANDDAYIEADVINPNMELLLKKKGFVETDRIGGHTIMRRQEDVGKGNEEDE